MGRVQSVGHGKNGKDSKLIAFSTLQVLTRISAFTPRAVEAKEGFTSRKEPSPRADIHNTKSSS